MSGEATDLALLAEVDDLLRTAPTLEELVGTPLRYLEWIGRGSAVVARSNVLDGATFEIQTQHLMGTQMTHGRLQAGPTVVRLLHKARTELRLKTGGPSTAVIRSGAPFDYFDEVRKLIESAREDLLFVDPYLDADFAATYLTFVADGVSVRLLGREKVTMLVPAVALHGRQHGKRVEVRSAPNSHDRFLFVDHREAYHSGASFKDGGVKAPTILSQVVDSIAEVRAIYETKWQAGQVLFPLPARA